MRWWESFWTSQPDHLEWILLVLMCFNWHLDSGPLLMRENAGEEKVFILFGRLIWHSWRIDCAHLTSSGGAVWGVASSKGSPPFLNRLKAHVEWKNLIQTSRAHSTIAQKTLTFPIHYFPSIYLHQFLGRDAFFLYTPPPREWHFQISIKEFPIFDWNKSITT